MRLVWKICYMAALFLFRVFTSHRNKDRSVILKVSLVCSLLQRNGQFSPISMNFPYNCLLIYASSDVPNREYFFSYMFQSMLTANPYILYTLQENRTKIRDCRVKDYSLNETGRFKNLYQAEISDSISTNSVKLLLFFFFLVQMGGGGSNL